MKKTAITSAIIIALLAALTVAGSLYLLDYALSVSPQTRDVHRKWTATMKEYPTTRQWMDSIRQSHALRDTFMTMPNGERHHALFVRDPRACGRTAVLIHGYHDSAVRMLPIASIYSRMGYNIFLPDLHAHGQSQGDDVQMGWKDRDDVKRWMAAAERMFRNDSLPSAMVVHGVSMGAATAMCISGDTLPAYVRCFVEDCGYTSAWDELAYQMKEQFHLPAFPLLYVSSAICKMRYGWSFGEASALSQVAKSTRPMLFIHGDDDTFVPFAMVFRLYKAKTQPIGSDGKVAKELFITKNTDHAHSFRNHPQEYARRVREFVERKW